MKTVFAILTVSGMLAFAACNSSSTKNEPVNETEQTAIEQYTCPMHPEVIQDKPGKCPDCGMDLVKKEAEAK